MRADELYAQVLLRPDDAGVVKVWADRLLEQGDPRGEFVVLQLAQEEGRLDANGEVRMRALQEAHQRAWLPGQVGRVAERAVFRRGVPIEVWLTVPLEPKLVSADWKHIPCVGLVDGEQLVREHSEFVTELLWLPMRGVKGVTSLVLPLLHASVEELSIHAGAVDELVLAQLGRDLRALRRLHVQGASRPVQGHLVCSSVLASRVEELAIDFTTFELRWQGSQVRVHVFVEDPPLLRIEAELRAGPRVEELKVLPMGQRPAVGALAPGLQLKLA
jgi:uncharacterized protein (TIGR02996 family)